VYTLHVRMTIFIIAYIHPSLFNVNIEGKNLYTLRSSLSYIQIFKDWETTPVGAIGKGRNEFTPMEFLFMCRFQYINQRNANV
jgi:hypothetical protein